MLSPGRDPRGPSPLVEDDDVVDIDKGGTRRLVAAPRGPPDAARVAPTSGKLGNERKGAGTGSAVGGTRKAWVPPLLLMDISSRGSIRSKNVASRAGSGR